MAEGSDKPLVIIGAGGTGGHMFPASAFASEMRSRGWQVGLISDVRGLRYAEQFPADWKEEVQAASPSTRNVYSVPAAFLKLRKGVKRAANLMKQKRPALVTGFGGYPAYPALSAANRLKIPIIIHEQNAVLGRVNRRFAKIADVVASGFQRLDKLPSRSNHIPIGNPVRAPIAAARSKGYPSTDGKITLLITGGSQGSRILGEAIPLAIANHLPSELQSRLSIMQQVREEQVTDVVQIYARAGIEAEVETFFKNMSERLAAAHLVIARSGAGTVSEIAAVGRPSILIPLKIAMDDHQTANALSLAEIGAADIVTEDNLYPNLLGELLRVSLENTDNLKERAALAANAGSITAAKDLADIAEHVSGIKS